MISTTERRNGENARIPCAIPVELAPDERAPGFEAAAVDLSAGGLSLRAASLPEVGSTLHCRFESLPGGTQISGRGEVVWAKLSGERSGEFGLRFTEIEPEAQALISEMIAERVARANGGGTPRPPRTATLEFEHVDSAITAKLTRATGRDVVFEQPLDLLALGSGVVAHSDKNHGHGNILRVDLRMDGGTPTLALTVRFSEGQEEYGEYDWGEPESGTQPRTTPAELAAPAEVDTVPDLAAPFGVFEDSTPHPAPEAVSYAAADEPLPEDTQPDAIPLELAARTTLIPAQPVLTPVGQPGVVRMRSSDEFATPHDYDAHRDSHPSLSDYDAIAVEDLEDVEESLSGTYQPLQLSAADVEHLDRRRHAISEADRHSALVRFLRVFAAIKNLLDTGLEHAKRHAIALQRTIEPHLRRRLPRRTQITTTLRGVGNRPRRSVGSATARPGEIPKWTRGAGRLALLATCMLASGWMGYYYLSTAPAETESPEDVVAETESEGVAADLETSVAASTDPSVIAPSPSRSIATATATAARASNQGVQAAASDAQPGPSAVAFGHKQVPNAQRFVLRMTSPVKVLRGKTTPHGFSVAIPGSMSRDRAAPIAAANDAVAEAKILNRKGNSELTVRFVEGRSPAYRVSAQQAELEVLISE